MGGRVGSPAGFPTGSPASPLQPLPTAGSTSSPVKPPPPPKPSGTARELEAGARDLTVVALRQRLAAGLEHFQQHAAGEMERLLGVQQKLAARDRELGATVAAIQSERAGCEGLVTELHLKAQQLDKWLQENEWKMPKDGQDIDINAVVMAADDLSRQALAAQAEDLAVEDTLTVLDKACQEGKLDAPEYLRQVRILCKRQFFARAKGLKVAAVQQSQPPPPHQMARGYSLTHGDSWAQSNILTNPLSSGK